MRILFYSLIGLWVCWQSVFSQTETVVLTFNELPEYINAHSPIVEQFNQLLNINKVERKMALSWNNPNLNYSEEALDNAGTYEKEQFLTVSKQFEMPWTYTLRHQAWGAFEKAAIFSKKQKVNQFLSEMKRGYIKLQSMNHFITRLNHFKSIIDEISVIAQNQADEGTISIFDHKLFQMALFKIQSRLIATQKEKQQLEGEWKTKMGIDESQKIMLKSGIEFKEIQLNSVETYYSSISNTPVIQKEKTELQFLDKMGQAESSNLIPFLDVSAGLKRFSNNQRGYTFGLSMPIPLFNPNLKLSRKYKMEKSMQETNLALHQNRLKNKIRLLIDEINVSRNLLTANQTLFDPRNDVIDNILLNYNQGVITLTDVLNTIQIYTESLESYYNHLNNYYQAIFHLEAEFDETLITF